MRFKKLLPYFFVGSFSVGWICAKTGVEPVLFFVLLAFYSIASWTVLGVAAAKDRADNPPEESIEEVEVEAE
jgi:hypothetical protein